MLTRSSTHTSWFCGALCTATLFFAVSAAPIVADAALGDCGQPLSNGAAPNTSDCLYILQSSVGGQTCTPECICDVNGAGGVNTTDALTCLKIAVGGALPLMCPCATTTSTTTTTSTSSSTLGEPAIMIEASVSGDPIPTAALSADVEIMLDGGCSVQSIAWTQSFGPEAMVLNADTAAATIVLASRADYKDALIHALSEPPITEDQLPENVELPEGEFPGGLPNRFQVVGANPFALEESAVAGFEVEVVSSCGTVTDTVDVHAHVPFKVTAGIRTVPIGIPVVLHGRDHVDEDMNSVNDDTGLPTTYDWQLSEAPGGSTAVLSDASGQSPDFVPNVAGKYVVLVTDTTRAPGNEVVTMEIHAGTWKGVITGQDSNGRPQAADCTTCHAKGGFAADTFSEWKQTGHAEILTNNLNTSSHYSSNCFSCHGVGYDPEVDNGGFDDASDFDAFVNAGLLSVPSPDNWSMMLANFPDAARMANVQCENCHGPQDGAGTHTKGAARMSLSSDVCATCHGEPLRHARFQQWQLSGHANYELAFDEGESGSCSRCHTGNGFLTWLPILLDDDPTTDPTDDIVVDWAPDETHPQTCATCHDPHSIGTTSGNAPNATVRISGSTPMLIAGFKARGVGKGAICMTCHNSRRGLRNDKVWDGYVGTSEAARAPHGSAQTDMLMGQNAYLINTGVRGNHSLIKNTCVNCHMEQTDPPDLLAYNLGGTNHSFAASDAICTNCHGQAFGAEGVQEAFQATLDDLQMMIEDAILALIDELTAGGAVIAIGNTLIMTGAEISDIEFTESRGRQAVIVTLSDMTVLGATALSSIEVRDGLQTDECVSGLSSCGLYDFADEGLPKAGWNWTLVHNDGSQGVHNPSFALEAMDAAIDALADILLAP